MLPEHINLMLYAFIGYFSLAIILVLFFLLRRRGKIKVNILLPNTTQHLITWGKPIYDEKGMKLLIRKAKGKTTEWMPRVKQIFYYSSWKRLKKEVFTEYEAEETMEFKPHEIKQNELTKQQVIDIGNAKVIENEGKGSKPPIPPMLLYVIIGIGFLTLILVFLVINRIGL
jgi:hypothetical protein